MGDAIYGTARRSGGPGLHLHAREIVVPLYKNRAPLRVSAPVPEHVRARLAQCGWRGEGDDARIANSGPVIRPREAGKKSARANNFSEIG